MSSPHARNWRSPSSLQALLEREREEVAVRDGDIELELNPYKGLTLKRQS